MIRSAGAAQREVMRSTTAVRQRRGPRSGRNGQQNVLVREPCGC
jgi:hypothetical protein